jgi:hypothetical protein
MGFDAAMLHNDQAFEQFPIPINAPSDFQINQKGTLSRISMGKFLQKLQDIFPANGLDQFLLTLPIPIEALDADIAVGLINFIVSDSKLFPETLGKPRRIGPDRYV